LKNHAKHENEQAQKRPSKGVTLTNAHTQKYDRQISQKGMMIEE
jgi:hypothetical protein